jgi:hypothetical protein
MWPGLLQNRKHIRMINTRTDSPANAATFLNSEDDDKRILEVKYERLLQEHDRLRSDHGILLEIATALSSSSGMSEAGD